MNITDILSSIKNKRIMVVGDAMLDCYIEGAVMRISPEAPVPIMKNAKTTKLAGGSANVARNITSLSGVADLVAVIGADDYGHDLCRLLAEDKSLNAHFFTDNMRPTTTKIRHVAQGQHLLRSDIEDSRNFSDKHYAALLKTVEKLASSADCAILSDYDKGILTAETFPQILACLNQAGVKTIIDPKKQDFTLFKGADLVTPNRAELQQATGLAVDSDDAITIAARQLLQKSQINALLVTRSEQGMSYISHDTAYHIPAQILTVFDVAGAGDTVIAAMALALAGGAPIKNAMEFANITAAVSVSKRGTATVTPQEILRFAPHKRIKTIAEKMMNEADALTTIDAWRAQGLSIGFTNGCFDILHAGHVFSLSEAASKCDRLIVGLNADESVKRLKGDGRPLNDEHHRALVLAGLQAVDGIVIFSDDTPFALIQKIMPDTLFKGEDYQIDQIVGADIVQANGGTVERIALMDNLSTTKLIDKMRG